MIYTMPGFSSLMQVSKAIKVAGIIVNANHDVETAYMISGLWHKSTNHF